MGAEVVSWPALVQVLDPVNRGKFDVESGHIQVSRRRRGWISELSILESQLSRHNVVLYLDW